MAQRLRVATHRTPFGNNGIRLTVSIGVACSPSTRPPGRVTAAADEAVYEAKLQGRVARVE